MAEKMTALEAHRAGKLLLRRGDGSVVATFSASGLTPAEVARTAEEGTTGIAPGAPPNHGAQRLTLATSGT